MKTRPAPLSAPTTVRRPRFLEGALVALLAACGPAHPATEAPTPTAPTSIASLASTVGAADAGASQYPAAPRETTSDTLHGVVVEDPYRWLERADDPRTQRWVDSEVTQSRELLDHIPIRTAIKKRLAEVSYSGSVEAPKRTATRDFYLRREPGQERPVLYVRGQKDGIERPLLDPNHWTTTPPEALDGFWPSDDGRKVVYGASVNNADRDTFRVFDVDTGKVSDAIDGIYDSYAVWSPTGEGFYYRWSPTDKSIALPDLPGHAEVRFHRLGSPVQSDRAVRGPTHDPAVAEYPDLSRDGRWLTIKVEHGFSQQDVLVTDLRHATPAWITILAESDVQSEASVFHDSLYLKTDMGAPRGRGFRVDLAHPDRARWKEIVPQRDDAILAEMRIVGGRILLLWRKDDVSELETCALDGSDRRLVPLPAVGVVGRVTGNSDDDRAFLSFESYTVAGEVLEVDPSSSKLSVWRRTESPIKLDEYVTEQTFYTSNDGTRVPMFLVHRRDTIPSGDTPTMYWGYGGFGISVEPLFSPAIFPWLDRGGLYAEAAIRGGGDYGADWHRAGKAAHKQTAFDDYLAGAEALIKWKWTSPDRLMACGGSNGGLLVGAAITQRPDLFRAAFIRAPLLDIIRYPLFGSGPAWVDEYGSPDDPNGLQTLLSYSPYHRVRSGVRYPSVFVYTTDSDDRVDPLHARKFVAALQWATSGGPVVLSVAKNGGHSGPAGVEARVDRYADVYAFGLHAMGLDGSPPAKAESRP